MRLCGSKRSLLKNTVYVYDANALAYFAAAGITNDAEKHAVNTFILGLKRNGLYAPLALYLISPTSGSAALYDFISLVKASLLGGVTFSSLGFTFDGSTGYLDTGMKPNIFTTTSMHISCYIQGVNVLATTQTFVGGSSTAKGGITKFNISYPSFSLNLNYQMVHPGGTANFTGTSIAGGGLWAAECALSFILNQQLSLYSQGTLISSGDFASVQPVNSTNNMFIGANNIGGTPGEFFQGTISSVMFARTLGASGNAILYNLFQHYQQALNRSV